MKNIVVARYIRLGSPDSVTNLSGPKREGVEPNQAIQQVESATGLGLNPLVRFGILIYICVSLIDNITCVVLFNY
jgi:hypothetical protein